MYCINPRRSLQNIHLNEREPQTIGLLSLSDSPCFLPFPLRTGPRRRALRQTTNQANLLSLPPQTSASYRRADMHPCAHVASSFLPGFDSGQNRLSYLACCIGLAEQRGPLGFKEAPRFPRRSVEEQGVESAGKRTTTKTRRSRLLGVVTSSVLSPYFPRQG